jgi:acyl-coenzyme A synthetase/AMP-(fatty) acid ligase
MTDGTYDLDLLVGGNTPSRLRASFTASGSEHTLRELRSEAHAIARALRARGCARVLLACERLRSFVPALLGAWEAHVVVELPPNVQPATLEALRSDPTIPWVLHDQEGEPGLFVPAVRSEPRDDAPLSTIALDAPIVTFHTSGTTAAPKRIEKTARGLLSEVEALATTFASLDSAFLCAVPTFHIYGLLFGVLLPLRLGKALVDERPLFPRDVAAALARPDVGVLVATPAHLRSFLGTAMPKSKVAISSGARLDPAVHFELARELQWTVHDVLGSTETGGIATRSSPLDGYKPLASVKVTADEAGRLTVESPWAGRMQTDDVVEIYKDGTLRHLGRSDDVVKVAGRRASRAAIEATLRKFPGVRDAVVVAIDDASRGQRLLAAVTPEDIDTTRLRETLMGSLDPVIVPRPILALKELPRDGMGKLAKERLHELFGLPKEEPETAELVCEPTEEPNAFKLRIPIRSFYFRGHFDVFPILPAIVQLSRIVVPLARRLHPDLGRVHKLRRARFRRPLTPGTELTVKLTRVDVRVTFEIFVLGEIAAKGILEFHPKISETPATPR